MSLFDYASYKSLLNYQTGGKTGNQGIKGDTGASYTGPTGASYTGPTGASYTGPTGASFTGPTGASFTGPTGLASTIPGPQGDTGASFTGATGPASTIPGPTGPGYGPTGFIELTDDPITETAYLKFKNSGTTQAMYMKSTNSNSFEFGNYGSTGAQNSLFQIYDNTPTYTRLTTRSDYDTQYYINSKKFSFVKTGGYSVLEIGQSGSTMDTLSASRINVNTLYDDNNHRIDTIHGTTGEIEVVKLTDGFHISIPDPMILSSTVQNSFKLKETNPAVLNNIVFEHSDGNQIEFGQRGASENHDCYIYNVNQSGLGSAGFIQKWKANRESEFHGTVYPESDNTITLGKSSYRWSNLYSTTLTCSNMTIGGNSKPTTNGGVLSQGPGTYSGRNSSDYILWTSYNNTATYQGMTTYLSNFVIPYNGVYLISYSCNAWSGGGNRDFKIQIRAGEPDNMIEIPGSYAHWYLTGETKGISNTVCKYLEADYWVGLYWTSTNSNAWDLVNLTFNIYCA